MKIFPEINVGVKYWKPICSIEVCGIESKFSEAPVAVDKVSLVSHMPFVSEY